MPVVPSMKMDKRFKNRVAGRFERYTFETGVADKAHRKPKEPRVLKSGKLGKRPLGTYMGGPVRKMQQATKGTNKKIAIKNEKKYKFMTAPFRKRSSKELTVFIKAFFNLINRKVKRREVEQALIAVIQKPILRGAYGRNTAVTKHIKGFNRLLIDTAQMFKSIKAKVRVRRVQK